MEYMAPAAARASSSWECTYLAIVNAAVACPSHLLITAVGTPRRCTDDEWSAALEAALMVARRHDSSTGPRRHTCGGACVRNVGSTSS
jgi:hypothetical protein